MGSRGAITQKRGIGILQYAPQIKALWNPKYRIWSKFVEAKMTLENTSAGVLLRKDSNNFAYS